MFCGVEVFLGISSFVFAAGSSAKLDFLLETNHHLEINRYLEIDHHLEMHHHLEMDHHLEIVCLLELGHHPAQSWYMYRVGWVIKETSVLLSGMGNSCMCLINTRMTMLQHA